MFPANDPHRSQQSHLPAFLLGEEESGGGPGRAEKEGLEGVCGTNYVSLLSTSGILRNDLPPPRYQDSRSQGPRVGMWGGRLDGGMGLDFAVEGWIMG